MVSPIAQILRHITTRASSRVLGHGLRVEAVHMPLPGYSALELTMVPSQVVRTGATCQVLLTMKHMDRLNAVMVPLTVQSRYTLGSWY